MKKEQDRFRELEQKVIGVNKQLTEELEYSESYNVCVENIIKNKKNPGSGNLPPYDPPPSSKPSNGVRETKSPAWILRGIIGLFTMSKKIDKRAENIRSLNVDNRKLNQKLYENSNIREEALADYMKDQIVGLEVKINTLMEELEELSVPSL